MQFIEGNLVECNAQSAFDSNLDGISNDGRGCKVTASCEGTWPIVDGKFTCLNELGELAFGTFSSTTSASGWAYEGEGGIGKFAPRPGRLHLIDLIHEYAVSNFTQRRIGDDERVLYLASSDSRPEDHCRVFADGASNQTM